jgi:hypothetical protein
MIREGSRTGWHERVALRKLPGTDRQVRERPRSTGANGPGSGHRQEVSARIQLVSCRLKGSGTNYVIRFLTPFSTSPAKLSRIFTLKRSSPARTNIISWSPAPRCKDVILTQQYFCQTPLTAPHKCQGLGEPVFRADPSQGGPGGEEGRFDVQDRTIALLGKAGRRVGRGLAPVIGVQ